MSAGKSHKYLTFYIELDGAAGSTFDIDKIWVLGMDRDTNRSIAYLADKDVQDVDRITFDPRQLTGIRPRVTAFITTGTKTFSLIWRGDAYLTVRGNSINGTLLTCSDTAWQYLNAGGVPVPIDHTWTFTRQEGFLQPQ